MKNSTFLRRILGGVALAGSLLGIGTASATVITYNLNTEFSGGADPVGTPPWIVITISDAGANAVTIQIANSGLVGTEFNRETSLNVSDGLVGSLAFGAPVKVGTFTSPTISQSLNAFQADGDGKFDILFDFDTGGAASRFGVGESVLYTVTAGGLDATDFNLTSVPAGGNGIWHAAAHVQSINTPPGSGWIGDGPSDVPDGGLTIALLGFGLAGLGALRRKLGVR